MPPSLVSPYTPRVGTQIILTDLHYPKASFLFSGFGANRLGDLPLPALPRTQSDRGNGGDMGIPVQ